MNNFSSLTPDELNKLKLEYEAIIKTTNETDEMIKKYSDLVTEIVKRQREKLDKAKDLISKGYEPIHIEGGTAMINHLY